MEEPILNLSLIGISNKGHEFPIELVIGKPRPHEEFDWACSVAVTGLEARPRDYCGIDALQALLFGLRIAGVHLSSFVASGGELLYPEDRSPFPVEAYFPKPEPGAA